MKGRSMAPSVRMSVLNLSKSGSLLLVRQYRTFHQLSGFSALTVTVGTGNLLVTCGTFQIGSFAGNPVSSNKALTPYPMPRRVDRVGYVDSARFDSHWEFLQWRNYVWDRPTNISRFPCEPSAAHTFRCEGAKRHRTRCTFRYISTRS